MPPKTEREKSEMERYHGAGVLFHKEDQIVQTGRFWGGGQREDVGGSKLV